MKSVEAKEYLESLPRDVLSCYIGMPEVVIAVSLAEQEAEERMRAKAIEVYCQDCGCRVVNKCGIGSDSCIAFRTFIQKLNENEND